MPHTLLRALTVLSLSAAAAQLSTVVVTSTDAQPRPSGAPEGAPLVRATNLMYEGAFRLPQGKIGGSYFSYGGTALAFNSATGSLFLVGHDHHQQVAEINIPQIRRATTASALATAMVLQPFADATEGQLGLVGPNNVKIGGLLHFHGQLYMTAYVYYDASASQTLSHFVANPNLGVHGDLKGPVKVGTIGAGFVSGYFGLVPEPWIAALGGPVLNGNCCLGIISRTSYGPALFTLDPSAIGNKEPVPATPLLYYPSKHPLLEPGATGDGWSNTSTLFNGSTTVTGVVFPENTRSVLFFGRHGATFCYGPGTSDTKLAGTPAEGGVDRYCYDPTESSKGTHGFPYAYYVWAYDANDLAAVKAKKKDPWSVRPYATWGFELPYSDQSGRIMGATYDAKNSRIFVSQAFGDGEMPVIHALKLATQ
jgi:hypothetical protein